MNVGVGFDFDHTLGLDHGLEKHAYYELAAEFGVPLGAGDAVASGYIDELLARFRGGDVAFDAAVNAFCAHFGLGCTPEVAARYREICFALVDDHVRPIDGARELLAALRARGVPTAILTNGWNPLQALKVKRALAYDGPLLVSEELGCAKPDGRAFARLVDALGAERPDCWYVGDNPRTDIAGARAAGLRTAWFDWENLTFPADMAPADVVVHALAELPERLLGPGCSAQNLHA